jgi:hypothetical protein
MGREPVEGGRGSIPEKLVPGQNRPLVDDKIVDVHDPLRSCAAFVPLG